MLYAIFTCFQSAIHIYIKVDILSPHFHKFDATIFLKISVAILFLSNLYYSNKYSYLTGKEYDYLMCFKGLAHCFQLEKTKTLHVGSVQINKELEVPKLTRLCHRNCSKESRSSIFRVNPYTIFSIL